VSDLDLILLVLATTVFLVIVAVRLRPSRPPGMSVMRVTRQVKFKINGVTYDNVADIPDPRVRKVAEDALKIKLT
jgi:hypothetical protein